MGVRFIQIIEKVTAVFWTECCSLYIVNFLLGHLTTFFPISALELIYEMTLQYITLLCSVFIFAQVCSMPTTCHLPWRLVKTSYNLLENMGGIFPRECLDENIQITFPKSALMLKGSNEKAVGLYTIMEHIDFLFANDTFPESWDQEKAEHFLHLVYRLTEESKCEGRHRPVRENALNTYFNKLATLLRDKDHSFCAWEVIRKELLHVLKVILKLNSSKV
ncbi:interferon phi 2 [Paramisgurnus dabryanus]|uniref:interferon phi 2 n=1 Tax=Paramisgurnus dabryanus TaxID=90735 RepID=UPI003CCF4A2B